MLGVVLQSGRGGVYLNPHVLRTCALKGGKGGQLGVILLVADKNEVSSLRRGTQARIKLHTWRTKMQKRNKHSMMMMARESKLRLMIDRRIARRVRRGVMLVDEWN